MKFSNKGAIAKLSLLTVATVSGLTIGAVSFEKHGDSSLFIKMVQADDATDVAEDLRARVIATGIPGAGAVAEVGNFLRGGPNHDSASFLPYNQNGAVQGPTRVFVASTTNWGAPLAIPNAAEGSILSIDPSANGVDMSTVSRFASNGDQASAFGGLVQLYTAQSPAFVNGINGSNPNAATKGIPSVSLPLGISINNGNGRPWVANAPTGASGDGTISVIDPQGYPLVGAPDPTAGGIFTGTITNRNASSIGGLTTASLGTAILTKSVDLSGRAVFVSVHADGSVQQIHVQDGVDQLMPRGTVTPLGTVDRASVESTDPNVVVRKGIAFNWAPTRIVYIADPQANRLVALDLTDDGTYFYGTRREITSKNFSVPVDVAPTTREIAAGSFASNSTMGVGSDLYVLNRGDNTIVRMGQDGVVQAIRHIEVEDLDGYRANGIAVSSDGQTIYVTVALPGGNGALLAMPAFGQAAAVKSLYADAQAAGKTDNVINFSDFMFNAQFQIQHGVGPLFNQQACADCHSEPFPGGMGVVSGQDEFIVGKVKPDGTFDPLENRGGPIARANSMAELGGNCGLPVGLASAPSANVSSLRNAMTLRGDGLIDDINPGDMIANMLDQPKSVRGRLNVLADGRVGKFGWKANVPTLVEFMGDAFRNEMGLTNPVQPNDEINGCGANKNHREVDSLALQTTAMFLNSIDPPQPTECSAMLGATVFATVGCATCHTPSLPGPGARQPVRLYSDLLLHDMGPALADQIQAGSAQGNEWRTMPLWSLSERTKFLHDGRASSVIEAIAAHGGQAQAASVAFNGLSDAEKRSMMDFLGCI
jgi:hypothetical protein